MRVLQINAVNKTGSTGRNVYEIAQYMNQQGEEGYVATSVASGTDQEYVIGTSLDHKVHALLSRITGYQACFSASATKKLIQYIGQIKPDIVHINNVHSNYLHLSMLLEHLAERDIATVVTLHDCWFYTGHCFHYKMIGCDKWKTGCNNCPQIHDGNASWFFDTSEQMWCKKKKGFEKIPRLAVVGVSDWITGEARQSFLKTAKIVERVYNWVDIDIFHPMPKQKIQEKRTQYHLVNKYVILGVASHWDEKKGFTKFLELSRYLSEAEQIILVGETLENSVVPENITLLPKTESVEKLAEIYSMADVFVTFSREESFGKVSAEALACGTPVICYNTTANPELVGRDCGLVLEQDKVEAVVAAIAQIKEKGKDFYTEKCTAWAKQQFSMQKCMEQYMDIYRRLIDMKKE